MVSTVRKGGPAGLERSAGSHGTEAAKKSGGLATEGSVRGTSLSWIVTCVIGIYAAFLLQGYVQEDIYGTKVLSTGKPFRCPVFLVAMVCGSSGLLGLLTVLMSGEFRIWNGLWKAWKKENSVEREVIWQGFLTSLTYVGAMSCTNYALTKVNFPTQVLVKSAKAVPVVIGSWVMYRKRYPLSDYVMVAIVTLSLLIFQGVQLISGASSGSSSVIGFAVLFVSLTLDGMTGPRQDQLIARHHLGIGEMMFLINVFATPLCLLTSLILEGFLPWRIINDQLGDFLPKILLVVICGALGQFIVVTVLRDLGSLYLTLITTSRKLLAIFISVLYYKHSITFLQWVAIAMLFSAVIFKYIVSSPGVSSKKHQ